MPWFPLADLPVGTLITNTVWNAILGAAGSLAQLRDHRHGGVTGEGSQALGPLTQADYADGGVPAAPVGSLTRLFSVGGRLHFRAGGGSDELLAKVSGETFTGPLYLPAGVQATGTNVWVCQFRDDTIDNSSGFFQDGNRDMLMAVRDHNGTVQSEINSANGAVLGTPSGGLKGGGTLNVQNAYYLNGGLLSAPIVQRQSAPQSVTNSTTLVTDNDLSFSVSPNQNWVVDMSLDMAATASTAGFKCTFVLPAGASMLLQVWASLGSGNTSYASGTTPGAAVSISNGSGFALPGIRIRGVLRIGGSGGQALFQWAQTSASGTATTLNADSTLIRTIF